MGRWSNTKRAEMASLAAAKAAEKAKTSQPQLTTPPQASHEDAAVESRADNISSTTLHLPRGNIHRNAVFDEILAARGESQVPKAGTEPTESAEESAETAKPESATEPPKPAEAEITRVPVSVSTPAPIPETSAETVKTVRVKVDGREFDVPQAEVDAAGGITAYQKDRAAENRLSKASQTLAEVRRIQAQIAQWIEQQAGKEPVLTDDQFIQSKVDTIRFGTPEESAVALREVSARLNPRIDPNQLIVEATANMKHDLAVAKFRNDFQDIITNPLLVRLVPGLAQEALAPYLQNGRVNWTGLGGLDWNNFYSRIGNQIRGAVPRSSQPSPPAQAIGTSSPVSPDKEARKASIVEPLKAAAARAAPPEEPKEESREEIIDRMKKARGKLLIG